MLKLNFISNGAWIDGSAQSGMRKCFEDEFSSIYVLNLRGNQRTSGELSRKEGGKIFGSGSRTPIAITFLVKNPKAENKKAVIHYHDIGDYLSREDKLKKVKEFRSLGSGKIDWQTIEPNDKYDWINQRDGVFDTLISLTPEKKFDSKTQTWFTLNSLGVGSSRDAWVYNYSLNSVKENMKRTIDFFNSQVNEFKIIKKLGQNIDVNDFIDNNAQKISWSSSLIPKVEAGKEANFEKEKCKIALYRPFVKTNLYFGEKFIHRRGQIDDLYPNLDNLCICVSGIAVTKPFSVIITDILPDLEVIGKSQCFPLYWYEERVGKKVGEQYQEMFEEDETGDDKYIRHDGVSDWILKEVRSRYGNLTSITKEDIFYYVYGILHSEEYRTRFADDLRKSLPRIPIVDKVADFVAFTKAGRALAELHLNYETVEACPGVTVSESGKKEDYIDPDTGEIVSDSDAFNYYRVEKMRFPTGQKAKDKPSTIIYNPHITIENIPAEAYDYVVNGKSAIEWIMERYAVTIDKDSLIKNDCNDWGKEHNQPRYILDLLLSVINVSIQTMQIEKALPSLHLGTNASAIANAPAQTAIVKPMAEILDDVDAAEKFTHYLPVYNLKAACGVFEDNELPTVTGWTSIESTGLHPKGDQTYFVCQAKGESMQPKINDGDYVVCRFYTPDNAGSRNGKIVLATISEFDGDYDGRYTIKEYHSTKNADGSRQSITLKPFNPDFDPIELNENDDVRVVAEVVKVL